MYFFDQSDFKILENLTFNQIISLLIFCIIKFRAYTKITSNFLWQFKFKIFMLIHNNLILNYDSYLIS